MIQIELIGYDRICRLLIGLSRRPSVWISSEYQWMGLHHPKM